MQKDFFPQMNTLVKMRELTLLSKGQKNELCDAADTGAVLNILNGTDFFVYACAAHTDELASALEAEQRGWIDWCAKVSEQKHISQIYELPLIIHNLKIYSKETVLRDDLSELYIQNKYGKNYFARLLNAYSADLSAEDMRMRDAIETAVSDFSIHQSFLRVDFAFTFYYHTELLRLSDEIKDAGISHFILSYIDLEFLSILLQTKGTNPVSNQTFKTKITAGYLRSDAAWLLSASEAERDAFLSNTSYARLWASLKEPNALALFDVYADNYLLHSCLNAKFIAFGYFPLFALLFAKTLDIKNVRVLVSLKAAGAEKQEIKERMRNEYEL